MHYGQLGPLDHVSRLTLGGGGLGRIWGETTIDEAVATVHAAIDGGMTLIDTAPMYRDCEAVIGEAFAGELVGLAELDNGDHVVRFCGHLLGLLDRHGLLRRFAPPRPGLREPTQQSVNHNLSTISLVQNVGHQPG